MAARQEIRLELLGVFRLRYAQTAVVLRPSSRRLIALLAVTGTQARLDAAARLWPDLLQARAASNLRTAAWRIRQDACGLLVSEGDVLRLEELSCDLTEVRDWARRTVAGEQLSHLPEHAAAELLPRWSDEWLIEPREELRLLQLHALEALAQRLLMAGRLAEACTHALTAVMMDPLRESATRLLIEIHLREGNTLDAVRRFHRFEELLDQELDVAPSPAITSLVAPLITSKRAAGVDPRRLRRT
ncbi:MAG TPA: BTAD domain-containing putative transcriptional regulator [Mycobacteriales bacterium]|nr:BTAD domain-containing putative transcriptional regulator [Mycobacteriales bacterium]